MTPAHLPPSPDTEQDRSLRAQHPVAQHLQVLARHDPWDRGRVGQNGGVATPASQIRAPAGGEIRSWPVETRIAVAQTAG